jgi:hypothetical protein
MNNLDLTELARVVELLKTQDNAITSDPVFMVQQRHRQYGMDEAYCEKYCFVHGDDSDHEVNEESDPVRFAAFSDDDFGDEDPEFWTRTGYIDTWQNIQPFLTREAAEEFRKREAHNLGETRVYVESGYRNAEWKWLREVLPAVLERLKASDGASDLVGLDNLDRLHAAAAQQYLTIRTHAGHCNHTTTGQCVCYWADASKGPIVFIDDRGTEWALRLVSLNPEGMSRAATPEDLARLGYRMAAKGGRSG